MTDPKAHPRSPEAKPPEPEPKPKLLGLSASQLTGGALAAMTSAVIGAQLGVAGTVLGAAVGSLVAGVGGVLYTESLRHTRVKITTSFVARRGNNASTAPVQGSDAMPAVSSAGVPDDDTRVRTTSWDTVSWDLPAVDGSTTSQESTAQPSGAPVESKRGLPWKPILLSAAAVFALAIAGITGYELVSGQSLSGGDGTTITQVSEARGGNQVPTDASSTDTSAEPSAAPSESTEPSQDAEPSTGTSESVEPSQSAEPSQSVEPTPGAGATEGTGESAEPPAGSGGTVGAEAGGAEGAN